MHLYEFTNAVLMCQPSLSLCTVLVPGDIKLQPTSKCISLLTYFDLLDPPPHIVCAQKRSAEWDRKRGGSRLFYGWVVA